MLVTEVVLMAFFVYVILGVTDTRAPKGFAPLAIGLVADPDPPDLDPGEQHLGQPGPLDRPRRCSWVVTRWSQLWVFLVAPIVGGLIAGATYAVLFGGRRRGRAAGGGHRGVTQADVQPRARAVQGL